MDILLANSSPVQKDHKEIWKDCLTIIKKNVPQITYNTWFLPIKPISLADSALKVEVPSEFFIDWIEEHYSTILKKALVSSIDENAKITYSIVEDKSEQLDLMDEIARKEEEKKTAANHVVSSNNKQIFDPHLNPRYKFDNFIKGEGNQLARAAAIAISDNPGETSFNPFFIYGGVGLGKTHLIQAIGNQIIDRHPNKKAIYLSMDTFTVEFVDAIQNDSVNEFSHFYKTMDVLIIDDIQFLSGRERTQDLFFQIFNILHQSGKQIILSSDKPPKDLKGLNERLISRFQWGLTADIQPPDFETRVAILKNKSEAYGIKLSNEIMEYIALNITSNIRELEGCLIKLLASSSLNSQEIEFELAKKVVKEISTQVKTNISIETITKEVCSFFKLEENKVREKNRKKEIVLARQIAMYLSKKLTTSSLKTIGLHFGGRDHSTVIHAFNTIEQLISNDAALKETIAKIKSKIELSAA